MASTTKKQAPGIHFALRLPVELDERIEKRRVRISQKSGVYPSRTQVVIAALQLGLEELAKTDK